jgi:hypothetical protein
VVEAWEVSSEAGILTYLSSASQHPLSIGVQAYRRFGPLSGRQIELKGMTISRIEGAKIVEEWQSYANLSMMDQLGLAPEQ